MIEPNGRPDVSEPVLPPHSHDVLSSRRTPTIFKTTTVVILCTAATGFALGATAIVTARLLGPSGRGVVVLIVTLVSLTALVSTLGTNVAARVHLVSPHDPIPLGSYLGISYVLTLLQFFFCALVSALLLPVVKVPLSLASILLVAVYGASSLLALLLRDALYGLGYSATAAFLQGAGSVAGFLFVLALALLGVRTVLPYVAALTLGSALWAVSNLVALGRVSGGLGPGMDRAHWLRLVKNGAPGLALSLSENASFRFDRYLTGVFLPPSQVGIYSVAATFSEFLWVAPLSLGQVLFHRVASRGISSGTIARLRRYSFLLTLAIGSVLFALVPFGIRIGFGPSFRHAIGPSRVLILGALAIASYYVDNLVLAATGRIASAGGVALNGFLSITIGDLVLIPLRGIEGAAWASTLGYTLMALLSKRHLDRELRTIQVGGSASGSEASRRSLDD
jgi:O-antigen/teichoic acid export membrane protein